jgi:ATP-dependent RNA circularization protein (DNA/RNA ligase family)
MPIFEAINVFKPSKKPETLYKHLKSHLNKEKLAYLFINFSKDFNKKHKILMLKLSNPKSNLKIQTFFNSTDSLAQLINEH